MQCASVLHVLIRFCSEPWKMSFRFTSVLFLTLPFYFSMKANGQTIHISGNQTVAEGTNVTFSCIVTSDRPMRSNWLIIFPNDRNLNNIRLQGGNYTPSGTDTSLFHVPDLYPGVQEEFTFVRISSIFDMAKVQCFNGGAQNSSFIDVIRLFTFGENVTFTEKENTTGFFPVDIASEGDDIDLIYTWTRDGIPVTNTSRVSFQLRGINFTDGEGGMQRSDLGVYALNISNFAGYTVTYLTLNVQYPPTIAGSGVLQPFPFEIGLSNDIIQCGLNSSSEQILDGNPFPTITWSLNGTLITNDSAKYTITETSLIVRDVSRDDAGLYKCTAVNMFGFDTILYDIETYEAPSAPIMINVTPGTTTNLTVVITWNSPQDTDGLPVDSYVVYLSSDGSKEQIRTMDNSTSVVIKNLLPALSYTVEVAAVTQRLERFFEGKMSDPVTFTSRGNPILNETVTSTIDDNVIRIQWSVLTDGGKSIVGYIVDWIVPGSSQFVRAPGGTIESDKIYWEIDLGRVLAGRIYRYRIQAVNSGGFISDYVYFEQLSSKGLPASPSVPRVTVEADRVLVALRTDITGIVSNNVTLVFEVEATNNLLSETIFKNRTVINYVSPNDALVEIEGLAGGSYYTFRSRVFNIYGTSEYSSSTAEIFISESIDDDDDNNTRIIIGAIVGGTLLLILVILFLFTVTYVLFHHRAHAAASYAINGANRSPENVVIEDPTTKIPQYADNPEYGSVKQIHRLPAYDTVDLPMTIDKTMDANEKQPYELTISVMSNEKEHLQPSIVSEYSVSPIHSVASSTLV